MRSLPSLDNSDVTRCQCDGGGGTYLRELSRVSHCFWVLVYMETISSHQPVPECMTVADVAATLKVSDDTVLKQFGALEGVIDIGTPGSMHRRRKRVLRIPWWTLERYLADKQVKVRRR
jgi:hypothetical protein